MRGIGPNHSDLGVIDALNADVGVLAHVRGVGPADDFVLSGFILDPVAHLEVHREHTALRRVLLGWRLSHARRPSEGSPALRPEPHAMASAPRQSRSRLSVSAPCRSYRTSRASRV